jgi:hypothetical protein
LGLSFYRPVSPALLLDPLRKRGALTAVKIRDGIHYCTLAAPLPLFGTGAALLFRDRTLFIAPTGGALEKLRRRPFPFPATGGIFVGATPGRIVGIMGKKDARNDLRTFLQTFSRAGLFLMEARHSGPYIYFKLRQKPER